MTKPLDLNPTDRMLRQFAGLWIVFVLALAGQQAFYYHRPRTAVVIAVVAVTVGLIGLVWPRWIKPLFVTSLIVTYPIGWVVSHVILALLFYGVFTPIALFFRLRGRDVIGLKPHREAATYWSRKPRTTNKRDYLRQF
jgi:hypothetical protein